MRETYPYVVEIPADLLDVDSSQTSPMKDRSDEPSLPLNSRETYPYVVEIPADLLDVDTLLKGHP